MSKPIADIIFDSSQFLLRSSEIGTGVCEGLTIILGKKFFPLNVAHAVFKAGNVFLRATNLTTPFAIMRRDWKAFDLDMISMIFFVIKTYPSSKIYYNEWCSVSRYDVDGVQFVVEFGKNPDEPVGILFRNNEDEKTFDVIRRIVWNKFSTTALLSINKGNNNNYIYSLHKEDPIIGHQSDQFNELLTYTVLFLEKNIPRSMLLYGPPGTGKSTLCKLLVEKLHLRTLIVPIEELEKISLINIINIMNLIKPDAIIIDDFDKMAANTAIVSVLELLAKRCKLVLVTANNINIIKEQKHLVRPGRFDVIKKIDNIDSRVIMDLLTPLNYEFYEDVRGWPVAFVQELKDISDALGKERAKQAIPDLAKRVLFNRTKKKTVRRSA